MGSRVANSWSATRTSAPVRAFRRVDFPAFVYPAIATCGMPLPWRRARFVVAGLRHRLDVAPQLRDPPADVLAVDLELRLAAAHPGADPTAGPAERLAPPTQPRQQVVQLRQLHLGAALPAARVQREDVEDQRGSVDHLHAHALLEGPQLAGGELVVEDHDLGPVRMDQPVEVVEPALADERRGIGLGARLHEAGDRLGAGRVREGGELVEVVLGDPRAHAHEDRLLPDRGAPRRRERRFQDLSLGRTAVPFATGRRVLGHQLIETPWSRSSAFRRTLSSVPSVR